MTDTELPSVIASIAKEIDSTPVLSAEEERDLIARLKDDRPALNRALVLHNLAFALSQSNKYQEHSESREDMLLRALTGLVAAAEKFNPDQGVRFSTYAGYHIKLQFRELYDKNLAAVPVAPDAPIRPLMLELAKAAVYDLPHTRARNALIAVVIAREHAIDITCGIKIDYVTVAISEIRLKERHVLENESELRLSCRLTLEDIFQPLERGGLRRINVDSDLGIVQTDKQTIVTHEREARNTVPP